ncbi:hypothetical protein BH11PSE11_BH11PSE11_32430 [soil metagenome]
MTTVFIYGGSGRFTGSQFEWASPEFGSEHKFMLFLSQDRDEPMQEQALAEVRRFGFEDVQLFEGRKILVEALNQSAMAAFRQYYEGAFLDGSSLVWYP